MNGNLNSNVGRKGKKHGPKCYNCKKLAHKSADCYSPGSGKAGQGPHEKNQKGRKQEDLGSSANVANHSKTMKRGGTMFAFSATSSFCCISTKIRIPAKCCSIILDSGASHHYCPDKSKFKNITPISDVIKLADGHTLPALGIGDVYPMTISGIKSCFKNVLMHLIWHSPSF